MHAEREQTETEIPSADAGVMTAISRAEIDSQITTARAYPRSIRKFLTEAKDMVTLDTGIAEACMYALPRDGKTIEGPSARFAEIVAHAWGNCRAGARVVAEEGDFVIAQGIFHDLERNVSITFEVKRRITDKYGKRYKPDMIGVTGNAASSIAFRNAVLKGVPKAMWQSLYDAAKRVAVGDATTLVAKRDVALAYFAKLGVHAEQLCGRLGVGGIEDIGLDELAVLNGLRTAIRENETTVDQAFAPDREPAAAATNTGGAKVLAEKLKARSAPPAAKEPERDPDTGEVLPPELQS